MTAILSSVPLSVGLVDSPECDFFLLGDVAASGVAWTIVVVALIGMERVDLVLPSVIASEGDLCAFLRSRGVEGASSAVIVVVEGAVLDAEDTLSRDV